VRVRERAGRALAGLQRIEQPVGYFPWVVGLFTLFAVPSCLLAASAGRPWAWLALLAAPAAIALRKRPLLAGGAIVIAGSLLRAAFVGIGPETDQVAVSRAAGLAALGGENPYGRGYDESVPPGAPYPYGPLALLWFLPGVWAEVIAGTATLVLLLAVRAWFTLAGYASFVFVLRGTTMGLNDVSPGFLLTAGLLLLAWRPWLGGALLAAAAALKPYALAWFPAAVGFGRLPAVIGLGIASAIAWSPLLAWGPASFLRSVEAAMALHSVPAHALNVPQARLLAIPLALAGFLTRRWTSMVLLGLAVFLVVLFFDRWASLGYILTVVPIVGIVVERRGPSDGSAAPVTRSEPRSGRVIDVEKREQEVVRQPVGGGQERREADAPGAERDERKGDADRDPGQAEDG
jgi:hypothetical protein